MTAIRSFPAAFQYLVTQIRRIMKDPTTDPSGNPRPTSMLRVQDLDIYESLNDTFIQMQTELDIENDAPSIASTDITYTEDANNDGCELPSTLALLDTTIIRVEDRSTSSVTRELTPVTNEEIIKWESPLALQTNQNSLRMAWCVRAAETPVGNPLKLVIRPTPAATSTFRVYYIANPFVYIGGTPPTDSPALTSRWRQLVATNTACAMLARSGDAPQDLLALNEVLWEQFRAFGGRTRTKEHVVSSRDWDF